MIEGIDYCYVFPDNDKQNVHIRLLSGKFKNTVYKYGKVGLKEENQQAYLQFNYDVIESPINKIENNEEFKNTIGDLLTELLARQLNNEGSTDEDRADYFEEPNPQ